MSQEEIKNEIVNARERLAQNLGHLDYSLSAKGLIEKAKRIFKNFFTDESGQLRIDRIAISLVLAVIALLFSRRD